jgi:hypothetical protein
MAGSGSLYDTSLMKLFIKENKLMRHPFQSTNTGTAPHNDPKSVSRDQVLAFFYGLNSDYFKTMTCNQEYEYCMLNKACSDYANSWFINSDINMPHNRLYLYKLAKKDTPLYIKLLGYPMMFLHLIWACFIKPKAEMCQTLIMCQIFGQWWIDKLDKWHPNLSGNIIEYFYGWRNRKEIADKLLANIK